MTPNRYLLLGLFILLLVKSSLSQCKIKEFDQNNKDLVVIKFINYEGDSIKQIKYGFSADLIYSDGHFFIFSDIRKLPGSELHKNFSFYKGVDTMIISVKCGHDINFFIKDMPFEKGIYNINILDYNFKLLKGDAIITNKYLKEILFINSYYFNYDRKRSSFKNLFWKDLEFYKIDLKDTSNVELINIVDF